jgi:aspartyl-tRNA(Asn)/glutamyl-tRNA(Gln) amidotransferase subunit B
MRADVNVSVRRRAGAFGTRCEIKNVNSIRFAGQAIEAEAQSPDRHPRRWRLDRPGNAAVRSVKLGETRSMRSKEEAHDYRYFPDPDLLPLEFDHAYIDEYGGRPARTARPEAGALRRRLWACPPTTRWC